MRKGSGAKAPSPHVFGRARAHSAIESKAAWAKTSQQRTVLVAPSVALRHTPRDSPCKRCRQQCAAYVPQTNHAKATTTIATRSQTHVGRIKSHRWGGISRRNCFADARPATPATRRRKIGTLRQGKPRIPHPWLAHSAGATCANACELVGLARVVATPEVKYAHQAVMHRPMVLRSGQPSLCTSWHMLVIVVRLRKCPLG